METTPRSDCNCSGDTPDPRCPACALLLMERRTNREPGSGVFFQESTPGGFMIAPED